MDRAVRFNKKEMMICARSAVSLDGPLAEVKVRAASLRRERHCLTSYMPAQRAADRYGRDCQLRPSPQEWHQPSRQLACRRGQLKRLLVDGAALAVTSIRPGGRNGSDASPEARWAPIHVRRLAAMQTGRHQGGVATKSLNSGVPV